MLYKDKKVRLTGEAVSSLFKNNFDLANHAISLAKLYVQKEEPVSATKLLDEIRRNPSPATST